MLNLLSADFYKLKHNKSYWICTLIAVLFGVLIALINWGQSRGGSGDIPSEVVINSMAMVIYYNTIPFFAAIFISMFITSEYTNGTIKSIVSKGFGRELTYLSKLVVAAVATAVILLAAMLTTYIGCSIAFGFDAADIGKLLQIFAFELPPHIAFAAFFTMIATVLKNSGSSIAICLSSLMFVDLALSLLTAVLHIKLDLGQYWLSKIVGNMCIVNPPIDYVIRAVIVSTVVFIVSTAIGMFVFKKRDIK